MDKEQARFILQSFRPDGADARDPDFAEALAVAAQDRELGEWLSAERARDAAFASAINDLAIPSSLREQILAVLDQKQSEEDFAEMDAAFIGALAAVRPPDSLREQIVSAMKVEQGNGHRNRATSKAPRRVATWMKGAAVAAALTLGAFVAKELTPAAAAITPPIDLADLEYGSIRAVSQDSDFAVWGNRLTELNAYLDQKKVPTVRPEQVPAGLSTSNGLVGCRLIQINEKTASLLCFDRDGQRVNLVVVRREDLDMKGQKLDNLATLKAGKGRCWQCPKTHVSVAAWGDKDRAFLLLGEMEEAELRSFF